MTNSIKNNHITIPGWAVEEPYNLKGNDLLVFSIINGFCQCKSQCFNGSLAYLQRWTNSSRQGILKNLSHLISRGLIRKEVSFNRIRYYVIDITNQNQFDDVNNVDSEEVNYVSEEVNKVETDVNKVETTCELSLHNNINNNINNINNNIKEKNKFEQNLTISSNIENIISYLNKICGTKFKSSSTETKRLLKKLLKDGYTIEEIKKVIDSKYEMWGRNPVKFGNGQYSNEFLRPSTLFGPKFESYLYEAEMHESSAGPVIGNSGSNPIDPQRSDLTF